MLQPKKKVDTAQAEIPYKKLSDIMKLELLEGKSADEIKKIWIEYHKDKDVLIAAIPSVTYKVLSERGKENPLFILPLPRSQGFEFFLLQFSNNTIHFTPLLCYQVSFVILHFSCLMTLTDSPFSRYTKKMLQNV